MSTESGMLESELQGCEGPGARDPLLTTVSWVLTALLILCLILGVFCLFAYPIILLNKGYFLTGFARTGIPAAAIPWIGVLGVIAAAELALTYVFLRNLRRIIDSVAHGHPFEPVNADRLRRMAWLSVAMQIVAVPMTRLIVWFDALPYEPNVHHNSDGISIGSILLTLVIFVLARVFRTGSEMQEDLEGTI
jgi:Protein of unknown function (DUF2975)